MRLNIKEGQTTTARHKVFQDAFLLDQSNNFILALYWRVQLTKKHHRQSTAQLSWIFSHSTQSYLDYIKGTISLDGFLTVPSYPVPYIDLIPLPRHLTVFLCRFIALPSHLIALLIHLIALPSHLIALLSHLIAIPSHLLLFFAV